MKPRITDADIALVRHVADLLRAAKYRGLKFRHAGGSKFKACCPFHNEKTPSFFVDADKQKYYCFGCGAGGDLFRFVEKFDGIEFLESVETLAGEFGVSLEDPGLAKYIALSMQRKKKLLPDKPNLVFPGKKTHQSLVPSSVQAEYDQQCGLLLHEIKWPDYCVEIGDPRIPSINEYAEQRLPIELLKLLGVCGCLTGKYGGRLVLPAYREEKLVYWQARDALDRDHVGKYLSPVGPSSGNCLFNLDRASKYEEVIICEGWFSAVRTGPNAIATWTNNLTKTHVELLKISGVRKVCLCYDPDAWRKTGKRESPVYRALVRLVDSGFDQVRVARLVGGDPDDLGSSAVQDFIKNSMLISNQAEIPVLCHLHAEKSKTVE